MSRIRINYEQVINETRKIEDVSNELKSINNNFQNMVAEIPSFWEGPASKVYREQCLNLQNEIKGTISKMNTLSFDIRKMAENIKKEDEALLHEANKLTT